MKKRDMFKDDSGAVTVDWVVLTAALVIIGGVVIGIIRAGLLDASSAIDETLVASATDLRSAGGASSASKSFNDYLTAAGGNIVGAVDAINADAPEGYSYSGYYETSTGTPLYGGQNDFSLGGTTYQLNALNPSDFTSTGYLPPT